MANIALDLDGTLIEKRWPEMGDWLPGSREAVQELLARGHHPYIFSARLSEFHPSGDRKPAAVVFEQKAAVREMLDEADLREVPISPASKPFWHVLVDDRVLWYPGRTGSWKHMPDKIEARVKGARNR